ncbi:MAG: ABC transporter permease [Saprospiraceae bacterium]|nr:ABC transporter permease [Saprospiraceae bacterium]
MGNLRNIRIATRIVFRDRIFSVINISGLAIGFAISLLIFMYVKYERSYEHFNPNADRVARLTMDYYDGQTLIDQDAETYAPLAPRVQASIPEVVDYAVAELFTDATIEIEGSYHRVKRSLAATPSFMHVMHHPLVQGDQLTALSKPHEIVLTERLSKRLFGNQSAIGKVIKHENVDFKVVGITKDCPSTTHLKFDLLLSYATLTSSDSTLLTSWNNNNQSSYVMLRDKSDFPALVRGLETLSDQLIAEDKVEAERVIAQPIADIHLYSNKGFEPEPGGDAASIKILFWVALLVIFIAIVNYINLTTSKSLDRAKEVGIRKVVGSSLAQLRTQFMWEALVLNVIAGVVALALVQLGLPFFIQEAGLPGSYQPLLDGAFWVSFFGLILISSLLSGLFPAFILSSFPAISVLKGKFSQSGFGAGLRKGLVVFQFAVTTFLLVQTIAVARQLDHMRSKDLGVDIERTIVVKTPETPEYAKHFNRYREALKQLPQVSAVALSNCVPGLPTSDMGSSNGINLTNAVIEHSYNFYVYFIDAAFIPTLGMELLAGENYRDAPGNDLKVVVNEEAIRLWGINSPQEAIGQTIDMWGEDRAIVGVVKNFDQLSPKSDHIPLILRYAEGWHTMASLRLRGGDMQEQLAAVQALYARHFPNSPFEYFFLDQEYGKLYAADQKFQAVFRLLSSFGILIACLGLFGLVHFTVTKRAKEISVRKVLGAGTIDLVSLLSRQFIGLIVLSVLLAMPIAYLFLRNWIEQYAYRISLSPWLFAIPAALIMVLALITVVGQTFRFSQQQPIEAIRND